MRYGNLNNAHLNDSRSCVLGSRSGYIERTTVLSSWKDSIAGDGTIVYWWYIYAWRCVERVWTTSVVLGYRRRNKTRVKIRLEQWYRHCVISVLKLLDHNWPQKNSASPIHFSNISYQQVAPPETIISIIISSPVHEPASIKTLFI